MTRASKSIALQEIEHKMKEMLAGNIKPYDAGLLIWSTAHSNVGHSTEIMHPLWLIWGALTDWVEVTPSEEKQAEASMEQASTEWLSLKLEDVELRTAYFDKWIYQEMGYKKEDK